MDLHTKPSATKTALDRATELAGRARELRKAQEEVQELTAREVQILAKAVAAFFETVALPEFTMALLPLSARHLRRVRHRILHRTIDTTATGTQIRALLLGRDGGLRLFSARSIDARELLMVLEPGRQAPAGVLRDVIDWSPTLRVAGFRPFEILDRLSQALDGVEQQIEEAAMRVRVQKEALMRGDIASLLPAATRQPVASPVSGDARAVGDAVATATSGDNVIVATPAYLFAPEPLPWETEEASVSSASVPNAHAVTDSTQRAANQGDTDVVAADAAPDPVPGDVAALAAVTDEAVGDAGDHTLATPSAADGTAPEAMMPATTPPDSPPVTDEPRAAGAAAPKPASRSRGVTLFRHLPEMRASAASRPAQKNTRR
jgi:hypothetical protein